MSLALSKNNNYIATFSARTAQTTLDSVTNNTQVGIMYIDGIGRELQKMLWKASPDKSKDVLASTTVYDTQSRLIIAYLPTPSDCNTGTLKTNVQTLAKAFTTMTTTLTQKQYLNPAHSTDPKNNLVQGKHGEQPTNSSTLTTARLEVGLWRIN